MKKNVLFLQSLILVALIAPSCVLGMDENKPIPTPADRKEARENKNKKGNRTPLAVSSDTIPAEHAIVPVRKDSLAESVMVTPSPEKQGLGLLCYLADIAYGEEENTYNLLATKKFNPDYISSHNKINRSTVIFTQQANNMRLTQIFSLCRENYPRLIKVEDIPACMAHKLLVKDNKQAQKTLKEALIAKDQSFLEQQNTVIKTIQQLFTRHYTLLAENLTRHIKERDELVKSNCDEIRRLKKGLIDLHNLNITFKLPKTDDGYCSDNDLEAKNIEKHYDDAKLLEKIKINQSIASTKSKAEHTLQRMNSINISLQAIQQLQHEIVDPQ